MSDVGITTLLNWMIYIRNYYFVAPICCNKFFDKFQRCKQNFVKFCYLNTSSVWIIHSKFPCFSISLRAWMDATCNTARTNNFQSTHSFFCFKPINSAYFEQRSCLTVGCQRIFGRWSDIPTLMTHYPAPCRNDKSVLDKLFNFSLQLNRENKSDQIN